tara:strand:+ start:503 stop:973 length:471 start_codon:yes stop_codon:yes gene_type:complete
MDELKPKHIIRDEAKFQKDRAKMGNFIVEGMETTGGTDIDWMIEHRGGFIIMENKSIDSNDEISISWGQMIAFEKLYEKLNVDEKCHFFFFGYREDTNYKNPESKLWYFEMDDWIGKTIQFEKRFNKFYVKRKNMKEITLNEYRDIMEKYWKDFEK